MASSRSFLCALVIEIVLWSCCSLPGTEVADDNLAKIVSSLTADEQKISAIKQEANQRADAAYVQAREKIVASAIGGLKRILEGSDDPALKVTIFKAVLNLDRSDEETLKFFKAIGNIEDILSEAARNPILPRRIQEAGRPRNQENISISAIDLDRLQKFFRLKEPYLISGACLRLNNQGSITLQDTATGSFTIRFSRGDLGDKPDDIVRSPFDTVLMRIRGVVILNTKHGEMCQAVGEGILDELLVSYDVETSTYAVFSVSGVVIKQGVISPRKATALFQAVDGGSAFWGSRIGNITWSQTPHQLVISK
jgi:hypothetical protein